MKMILALTFLLVLTSAHAVSWSYQVNVNNEKGPVTRMEKGPTSFKAGPYKCEVSAIDEKSNTEYRSLSCGVDTVAVSTGGLCTQKGAKFSSVQYAILNFTGIKNLVNVVVACKFD